MTFVVIFIVMTKLGTRNSFVKQKIFLFIVYWKDPSNTAAMRAPTNLYIELCHLDSQVRNPLFKQL